MTIALNQFGLTDRAEGVERRLVDFFVGDDQADWLLSEAQHARGRRALNLFRKAAQRLGMVQADRRAGSLLNFHALKQAGSRNGYGAGYKHDRLLAALGPAIQRGHQSQVNVLAAPHLAAARTEISLALRGHDFGGEPTDRFNFRDRVARCAVTCARDTDLPLVGILSELTRHARLSAAEMRSAHDGRTRWWKRVLREMAHARDKPAIRREHLSIEGRKPPRLLENPLAVIAKRSRFEITMFGDLDEEPVKDWLIDDLLGAGEFSCFWGMPGCGKSVAVGDAAFHVAAGRPWHGKSVRRGLVVFVAAERADLTKRRFTALRKTYGEADAPLAVVKGRLDLTSSVEDAKDIVAAVRGLEERTGEQCVWIVIDTIARTFGAGDENKQSDMGAYVQACDLIREELAAHVSLIHHCSRAGEKPRGSIALEGAVDATFKVHKSGNLHTLGVDKENDAPDRGSIRFRMEAVELSRDRRGKVTTAPIAVPDTTTIVDFEATDGTRIVLGTNKGPRKAVVAFRKALAEAGQDHPCGRRAVAVDALRKCLREAFGGPNVKPESLAAIERRELKALVAKGDAERIGEWMMAPANALPH
ncbi:AAA family ATPase [Methylobacterium sp. NEAU 140]|uniref:AAA family ATPase n=1 Tax=Methylobacterium sp. NEAU 140 TaxID=3064945 RepID=UPI0027350B36|nr:AAA family ATPase [Methylobacterium sp. NEAU 140]MDP4021045.1 AAA family ATPase [Methylobacterium sp. NEAU 140]